MPALAASPVALYGTSWLNPAYTGALLRLRRGGDNEEADWGPGPDGWAPLAEINAWLGEENGYFAALYDQSGNAHHALQTTAANQPEYSAISGRVTLSSGGTHRLVLQDALGIGRDVPGFSAAGVLQNVATAGSRLIFNVPDGVSNNGRASFFTDADGNLEAWGRILDGGSSSFAEVALTGDFDRVVARWHYTTRGIDLAVNAGTPATGTMPGTASNTSDTDSFSAPSLAGALSNGFQGRMTAFAMWPRVLTDGERGNISAAFAQLVPA